MYQVGENDFRRIGIRAAAARFNRGANMHGGATSGAGAHAGAPWVATYSERNAYILEVNRRMDALWRDIYQSHEAPEAFRQEFDAFKRDWERFVSGLSMAGVMLPSTAEYAERVDKQIEEWRLRFQQIGGKTSMPGYQPYHPVAPPFPWGKLFGAVAVIGVVVGVVYVGSRVGEMPTAHAT